VGQNSWTHNCLARDENPTVSENRFLQGRIVHRVDHASDLWTVRVDPGSEFHFAAGQYATLGVSTEARLVERAYSIVSSPYERELEFFFELVPGGALTPLLHRLMPGDSISVRRSAKGRFTLDTQSGRTQHLLLCTVTGVAPFVSYARTLLEDGKAGRFKDEHKLYVIQGASHSRELGYREELTRISQECPWLTYVPTVSRPWTDPLWQGERGRVDDILREYIDRWSLTSRTTTAYLCGHPEMIDHGKAILRRVGWNSKTVKEEIYFALAA
jgi:ferredoxin/flavodoxin---NADP+ reductase